jgi:hypothetical protein
VIRTLGSLLVNLSLLVLYKLGDVVLRFAAALDEMWNPESAAEVQAAQKRVAEWLRCRGVLPPPRMPPNQEVRRSGEVRDKAESWPVPAWVPCQMCDYFWCNVHELHAHDCPCPPVENWRGSSPYQAGADLLRPPSWLNH